MIQPYHEAYNKTKRFNPIAKAYNKTKRFNPIAKAHNKNETIPLLLCGSSLSERHWLSL